MHTHVWKVWTVRRVGEARQEHSAARHRRCGFTCLFGGLRRLHVLCQSGRHASVCVVPRIWVARHVAAEGVTRVLRAGRVVDRPFGGFNGQLDGVFCVW
eukprot:1824-Chlamydomonas_euryale.AAC.2